MFTKTARFYDAIYSFKDYCEEVEFLVKLIREDLSVKGDRLLDVACGTGHHLEYLKNDFTVSGLDLDADMVEIARSKSPEGSFYIADMIDFAVPGPFDVITCLFSSIGYVRTLSNLEKTLKSFKKHLNLDGVVIIEPWFTPATFKSGTVHGLLVNEPDIKIARVNTSKVDGRISSFRMHYLIGTAVDTEYYYEDHILGLFTHEETIDAIRRAGFTFHYDPVGLMGRGIYILRHENHHLTEHLSVRKSPAEKNITIQPITRENWEDVLKLSVFQHQKSLVPTVGESMAAAFISPWNEALDPYCIYLNNQPISFFYLSYTPESIDNYWIGGFFIDKHFQRRGLATPVIEEMIKFLKKQYPHCQKTSLTVIPGNAQAENLYRKFGFTTTGEINNYGEIIFTAQIQ